MFLRAWCIFFFGLNLDKSGLLVRDFPVLAWTRPFFLLVLEFFPRFSRLPRYSGFLAMLFPEFRSRPLGSVLQGRC